MSFQSILTQEELPAISTKETTYAGRYLQKAGMFGEKRACLMIKATILVPILKSAKRSVRYYYDLISGASYHILSDGWCEVGVEVRRPQPGPIYVIWSERISMIGEEIREYDVMSQLSPRDCIRASAYIG